MRVHASLRAPAASKPSFLTSTLSAFIIALACQPAVGASIKSGKGMAYPILASGYNGIIQPLVFEPPSTLKKLEASQANIAGDSPSWITYRTDGSGIAYVTSEDDPAKVYTLSTGLHVGKKMPVPSRIAPHLDVVGNDQGYNAGGNGSVASCIVGDSLYLANYDSGSASVLKLEGHTHNYTINANHEPITFPFHRKNGTTGPVKSRQDQSYAHDVVADPSGHFVYVPDLGADQIHVIRTATEGAHHQSKKPHVAGSIDVAQGSGPRHMEFFVDKEGRFAYLTSELANTLTVFKQNKHTGELQMVGKPVLAAPEGTDLGGNMTAGPDRSVAELAISPDGKHVYVSDRGDKTEDHIAIFKRHAKTGEVEFQEWVGTQGTNPRHISMSRDGKYLVVANQNTGNVVVLARDASSGKLTPTGAYAMGLDNVAFAGFAPVE